MSTNIKINVGISPRLIDLNRRQQKANREAFLIRDEAQKTSVKAFDQLERERIAAGLDPVTGRPITSARIASGFPRIDQEPAAFRFARDYYVAELLNLSIYQTQEGSIELDLTTENGTAYNFNLASTFAYPSTDTLSSGLGTVDLQNYSTSTFTYSPAGIENNPLIEFYSDTIYVESVSSPPPWGNTFSRTDVYTQSTTVARTPDSLVLMLPLKKDAFILATVGKGTRFRFATTQTGTIIHNYVRYDAGSEEIRYRHDWIESWTSDVSEQLDKYQWSKCFFVNKSTCREISSPGGLFELLEAYLSETDVSVTWEYDTTIYRISSIDGVVTTGVAAEKLAPIATLSRSISTAARFSDKFRLSGFLATNDGPYIVTPGIYKTLQLSAYDPRFSNPRDPALTNVSYMVDNFYGGSYENLPRFGLQSIVEILPEYEPKYYGHYRTKNKPIYNRNLIGDELVGLTNKTKVRTFTLNALAWDWNNPGYCRQQLLSLGFSSADLEASPLPT